MANWLLIAGNTLSPLGHTWSLAVEEHFYVVWPAALILSGGGGDSSAVLALAAISFGLRLFLVIDGASVYRVAYGTDTRADALLIGCLLAFLVERIPEVPLSVGIPLLIAAAIAAQYTALGLTVGLLGVALAGAVVIRTAAEHPSWLAWRPLTRLGQISYGVYLFHLPLWYATPQVGEPWRALLVLSLALLCAEASYRWIESPIRKRRTRGTAQLTEIAA